MSRVFYLRLALVTVTLGGCRQREAPVTREAGTTAAPLVSAPSVAPTSSAVATAEATAAPLVVTVPCEATAAVHAIADAGLGLAGAGRIQCLAGDGGVVYSVALPVAREARRALALVSIIRGHLTTLSASARASEIAATIRDSMPPRGAPLGLFLRDPSRYAMQFGFVEGAVTAARDVDGITELEVTTTLGAVVVTVPVRAPDDVYAGQRVQAYGLWYRLEDGAPRLAAIVARNPQSSAQRPSRPVMRSNREDEYEDE